MVSLVTMQPISFSGQKYASSSSRANGPSLRPVHSGRGSKRKQNFSLMFAIYSFIFFDCSLVFLLSLSLLLNVNRPFTFSKNGDVVNCVQYGKTRLRAFSQTCINRTAQSSIAVLHRVVCGFSTAKRRTSKDNKPRETRVYRLDRTRAAYGLNVAIISKISVK